MRGFDSEGTGAFFICTEHSERNYVIKKVNTNSLDRVLNEIPSRPPAELDTITSLMLPWWFTKECEQQLLSVPAEAKYVQQFEQSMQEANSQMTPEQLKARLKSQLEYYFSRENIATDRYLRIQMDTDQYVPIKIVANFPKVAQLTNDYNLIVQVLRESSHVQVDETGEKVRAASKRCTIILREIPENTDEKEVKAMFDGCPPYQSLVYGLNNSWYVTFETEEQTQKAYQILMGKTFHGKPIYARIKTGGAPTIGDPNMSFGGGNIVTSTKSLDTNGIVTTSSAMGISFSQSQNIHGHHSGMHGFSTPTTAPSNFNLGEILASYGFVPRATYRPASVAAPFVPASSAESQTFNQPTYLSRSHLAAAHRTSTTSPTTVASNTSTQASSEHLNLPPSSVPLRHSTSFDDKPQPLLPNLGKHRITDAPRLSKGRGAAPFIKFNGNMPDASKPSYTSQTSVDSSYNNYTQATPTAPPPAKYEKTERSVSESNNPSSGRGSSRDASQKSYRGGYESGRSERGRGKPRHYQDNSYSHSYYNSSSYGAQNSSRHSSEYYNSSRPQMRDRAQTQRYESSHRESTGYTSHPKASTPRELHLSTTPKSNSPAPPPSESLSAEKTSSRSKQHSESSEYNFTEVEFPSLVDPDAKPQPSAPPEKPPPFSAIVAGKKNVQKAEAKKKSYAQTLKSSDDHDSKSSS